MWSSWSGRGILRVLNSARFDLENAVKGTGKKAEENLAQSDSGDYRMYSNKRRMNHKNLVHIRGLWENTRYTTPSRLRQFRSQRKVRHWNVKLLSVLHNIYKWFIVIGVSDFAKNTPPLNKRRGVLSNKYGSSIKHLWGHWWEHFAQASGSTPQNSGEK